MSEPVDQLPGIGSPTHEKSDALLESAEASGWSHAELMAWITTAADKSWQLTSPIDETSNRVIEAG